ncbi:hypothetical protein BGZ54_009657 [Gamsiella multidivaricata]|nr:hypothetical protein BGZ54_009657 [Gamsiella multidivaricata]
MPPLSSLESELAEEERALRAEQEWFLTTQVKPSLQTIQKALLSCQEAARLQDDTMGALTLAISSTNNDTLKGFVTLAGSFIVKGELTVKLPKQPVVKAAIHSYVPSNASVPSTSAVPSTTASTAAASTSSSASSITAGQNEGSSEEVTPVPAIAITATSETSETNAQGSNQVPEQALGALPQQPPPALSRSVSGTVILSALMSGAGTGPAIAPSANIPQPPLNQHQLLHSYRPPGHLTQPYLLEQVKDVQNHTAQAIFRLEDYWTSGSDRLLTGGAQEKQEGSEKQGGGGGEEKKTRARMSKADINEVTRPLKTLLELMQRHLRAGIEAMARPRKEKLYPFRVCDPKIFSPALNEDFVIEFYIRDSQLVCAAYALQLTGGPTNGSSGSGDTVVLPASNKIGQTSKGGIKGKVATTLEDKVVQVQSSKLEEINGRLVHAEGLCRRLLYFLVLQESVAEPPV